MSSEPIVEMSHVRLSFDEKVILKDLNLAVKPQERLVILGQSGSGKSTTLRLVMGILHPNSGMVYQYSALISSLNVRDNLALPLEELTDKSRQEIDEIVDDKLALVGMEDT